MGKALTRIFYTVMRTLCFFAALALAFVLIGATDTTSCNLAAQEKFPVEVIGVRKLADAVEDKLGPSVKLFYYHSANASSCADYLAEVVKVNELVLSNKRTKKFSVIVVDLDKEQGDEETMTPGAATKGQISVDGEQPQDYNGIFLAERIYEHLESLLNVGYKIVTSGKELQQHQQRNDVMVLAVLRKATAEDYDFIGGLPKTFEKVNLFLITDKNTRKYLIKNGLANDTIEETDLLLVWRRYQNKKQLQEDGTLASMEYKLVGGSGDEGNYFEQMIMLQVTYSGFFSQLAYPIYDAYTEYKYSILAHLELPILYVYSSVPYERKNGLFESLINNIAKNEEYASKVYLVYVEGTQAPKFHASLNLQVPAIVIESGGLPYPFEGNVNSLSEIQEFIERYYRKEIEPLVISEDPQIYSHLQSQYVTYLVGTTLMDFLKNSKDGHSFIFLTSSPTSEENEILKNLTIVANNLKNETHFGVFNAKKNAVNDAVINRNLISHSDQDILIYIEKGDFSQALGYYKDTHDIEAITSWIEGIYRGDHHNPPVEEEVTPEVEVEGESESEENSEESSEEESDANIEVSTDSEEESSEESNDEESSSESNDEESSSESNEEGEESSDSNDEEETSTESNEGEEEASTESNEEEKTEL
eukprot:TRINITY_DN1001_c0_g1_i1.p1 TRINITY_DN1001_c0_g1~~TRINITY_DN1001_c0_g1_i1.p1  ORF type:complete len:657 (+),score=234.63 TRINITY_DN1001_c0_g1_i1:32-1972(+)